MFKIGYNTNGFTSHSLLSAIDIIGSLGYESIAITIDHHSLNPWDENIDSRIVQVKKRLEKYQLSSIVETGARFLLDPLVKHEPTLISKGAENREFRIKFIEQCLYIASALGSKAVSIWSGEKKADIDEVQAWDWLVSGCYRLSQKAADLGVFIGFEPEPGMFVENMDQYQLLKERVNHEFFRLTLDIGHGFITEKSVCESIRDYKDDIVNIHLEDMKKNKHDHLSFGEGDMDFKDIFHTLDDIKYHGQVNIELSRHSHNAVEIAEKAFRFINRTRG
ncbi:MAG: sugar phosphate isomerase/epimerase [Desulfobacula sp.]|jgi:L-ribulose-5-phosphate 3-epimerase|nr:sugar phosphate isomerase/epimerase [Desulfobacula sp.]